MEKTLYEKARTVALSIVDFEDSQLEEDELKAAIEAYRSSVDTAYMKERNAAPACIGIL